MGDDGRVESVIRDSALDFVKPASGRRSAGGPRAGRSEFRVSQLPGLARAAEVIATGPPQHRRRRGEPE